jgi:transposase-like protein
VRALLLEQPRFSGPPVFAVDVSVWPRRDAETSPDRAFHSSSPCQRTGSAVVRGWAYQWVAQLSPARDSWTAPVDVRRVRPTEQATEVAVEQVRAVVARLAPAEGPPLFVFDAWYDAAHFALALAETPAALRIRLRRNRCFYADLEAAPGPNPPLRKRQRNGAKFVCNDPATWPAPSAALQREDALYELPWEWWRLWRLERRPSRDRRSGSMAAELKHPSQKRYPPELRERAVRLALETIAQTGTRQGVVGRVAGQLGIGTETLRQWVKRAEIDGGRHPGVPTEQQRRLAELEREVRELRRANEMAVSSGERNAL